MTDDLTFAEKMRIHLPPKQQTDEELLRHYLYDAEWLATHHFHPSGQAMYTRCEATRVEMEKRKANV